MFKKNSKKGLAGIIASVLTIVLVLAAIIIIWNFLKPAVFQSSQEIEAKEAALSTNINIKEVNIDDSLQLLTIRVRRSAGGGEVNSIMLSLEDENGNKETKEIPFKISELETQKTEVINFSGWGLEGKVEKVSVAPVVEAR